MAQKLDPDLRALQEVRDKVEAAKRAATSIATWSQEQVDALCRAMSAAAARSAHDLARLAVEETGIGRVHYKILKNLFAAEEVWRSIEHEQSVGILARDDENGVLEVATPVGVVAAIVPTTNPTSTAIGKAMISIKARNAVVISPHPRARRCIGETAEVLRRAIERAGGPPDLVQSLSNPTIESTGALMKHRKVAMILATGGSGLVKAAYSSGKPAYGVGPGNVPVYIDRSADIEEAAFQIVGSQSFDNATFCCSEQALVLDRPIAAKLLDEMVKRGAHLCDEEETRKLESYCNRGGMMNPDVVGMDPYVIARDAGFSVPRATSLLLARQGGVGKEHPLSIEVLCPLLSVHEVDGWQEGCDVSMSILKYGGLGHTIGVWSKDESVLNAWYLQKPASRIIVNGPTSQGAVGFSTNLVPSLSLGCGPLAGNITSDNITARHLINIKRVAIPKPNWDSLYQASMARAASMSGESAPRGSGLPGDPSLALGGGRPRSHGPAPTLGHAVPGGAYSAHAPQQVERTPMASGIPSALFEQRESQPQPGSGSSQGAQASAQARRAPTFTSKSSVQNEAARTQIAARAASHVPAAPSASKRSGGSPSPFQGSALSESEIVDMMGHAGSGCPLGPCSSCPHMDAKSGACLA